METSAPWTPYAVLAGLACTVALLLALLLYELQPSPSLRPAPVPTLQPTPQLAVPAVPAGPPQVVSTGEGDVSISYTYIHNDVDVCVALVCPGLGP